MFPLATTRACSGARTALQAPVPDALCVRCGGRAPPKTRKIDTGVYRSEWSYLAYDTAGRLASVTNYGPTNIVTTYAYGFDPTDGQYSQVTDPDGRVSKTFVDLLGRTTKTVEDSGGTNRTTRYAYNAEVLPGDDVIGYKDAITADNGDEDDQTTEYFRGEIEGADRVTLVTYPDPGEVTFTYNTDGSLATRTDQRGWTTTFERDLDNGQMKVTETVTGGAAGTTQIVYKYDGLGRLTSVTDNNGGGPDSEVTYTYAWSGTSQTVAETQDVNSEGPWQIASTYSNLGLRSSLVYPGSRTLGYTYDALRRLDTITQSSATLADYEYKGLYLNQRGLGGAIGSDVVRLSFADSAPLDGYDTWGRVTGMRHYKRGTPDTDIAKFGYGYSPASNRLYQEDLLTATASELYGYDALHRLASFQRGTLNANKDGITGTATREQTWVLDHVRCEGGLRLRGIGYGVCPVRRADGGRNRLLRNSADHGGSLAALPTQQDRRDRRHADVRVVAWAPVGGQQAAHVLRAHQAGARRSGSDARPPGHAARPTTVSDRRTTSALHWAPSAI